MADNGPEDQGDKLDAGQAAKDAGAAASQGAQEAMAIAKGLDFAAVLNQAKALITAPGELVAIIKSTVSDPGSFFAGTKDEGLNRPLGFYVVITVVSAVFAFLNMLFAGAIGYAFVWLILTPVFAVVALVLVGIIVHLLLKIVGGKGGFADTIVLICFASWTQLLPRASISLQFHRAA